MRCSRPPKTAVLAGTPLAIMLADARAPAVLAVAPDAVMLADARTPAVLAGAPLAVMLADARAPAVLARVPLPPVRADAAAPALYTLTALSTVRTLLPHRPRRRRRLRLRRLLRCPPILPRPPPRRLPAHGLPPSSSCKDCGGLAWWGLLLVDNQVRKEKHSTPAGVHNLSFFFAGVHILSFPPPAWACAAPPAPPAPPAPCCW